MFSHIPDIIYKAGNIVKKGFYSDKNINFKGSVDLVTEYDVMCENYLKDNLSKLFPSFKIIAEESNNKDIWDNSGNNIVIDPIDGTTNFVHGVPHIAISVGIYENGKGKYGAVYNPILDEFYSAETSKGAFLNGKEIKVSKTDSLINSLTATGFPYKQDNIGYTIGILEQVITKTRGIRRLGAASLDLCYTARGMFDIYYEEVLKPWDMAAGIIIVREAGGVATNMDGRAHNLDSQSILAGNSVIHKEFLKLLGRGKNI